MKKQLLFSLLSIVSVCSILTSCGGGYKGEVNFKVPEGGFDTTKDVTIKFYSTMGDTLQKTFNSYLEDFNEIYPNIHVDAQFIGGYEDVRNQMSTELAAGKSEVNLAYCYPDHVATYNNAKSVICLDNLIEDEEYGFTSEEYKDFVKAFYDEGKSFGDGKMYCLPFSKSSEVMYYNKTFFDENNLKVPDHWFAQGNNDETSMEYVCKKIKELDGDSVPLGYDSESNLFITLCKQLDTPYTSATGEHYLFDNEQNKEFTLKLANWYKDGLITTKDLYGSYTSGLFTSTETKRCYICIGSSAGASYQNSDQFEVEIAPIPQEDKNNKAVIQQGPDVCIFANKDPQKVMASWLLLKYFTTNVGFQAEFSMKSGYTPVIRSVFDNEIYKEFLAEGDQGNLQAKSIKVCGEQESSYFTSDAFVGSSEARKQVGNIIKQTFAEPSKINKIFADAVKKCKG